MTGQHNDFSPRCVSLPNFCRFHAKNPQVRVFLLGAAPGVAQQALERINGRVSRDIVVGAHGPSMAFVNDTQEIDAVIEMVNASGATVLIVGLGAPKQEVWIHRFRDRMPAVKIFMGVGATIDYEAGAVTRSPEWVARWGLEWLHRVVTQPKRYWRRYLRDTQFFWLLLLDAVGLYRAPALHASNGERSGTA